MSYISKRLQQKRLLLNNRKTTKQPNNYGVQLPVKIFSWIFVEDIEHL